MTTYHCSIKSGKKGSAVRHSRYIAREGQFDFRDQKSDLIATGHGNLPSWASGSPVAFWRAADTYERANGAAYREFEMALPNELRPIDQVALVENFIERQLPHKTYQYAIHCPDAAIGRVRQPHVHLMYSDRLFDDIDRSMEQHFRRYNPNDPALGGCRKEQSVSSRSGLADRIIAQRAAFADCQNEMLERHGHSARVDHRSHAERGLKTQPAKRLAIAKLRKLDQEGLDQLRTKRIADSHRRECIGDPQKS